LYLANPLDIALVGGLKHPIIVGSLQIIAQVERHADVIFLQMLMTVGI